MKTLAALFLCAAGAFPLAPASCLAAEPPVQVDAAVEIYELPSAKAAAWQRTFEGAAEPDRQGLVVALRAGQDGTAKTAGFGQRVCMLNTRSVVETVELYRHPTEFTTKDGFASPTAFKVNKVGCTMTLEVTADEAGDSLQVAANIRDVALLFTQHYAASSTDRPGSIEQPVFASQTVETHFQARTGVPRLVGVYAPHLGSDTPEAVRLAR